PNALTSRLRIHTTNDSIGRRDPTCSSCPHILSHQPLGMPPWLNGADDLSQPDIHFHECVIGNAHDLITRSPRCNHGID
ncbi:hypothetical protein, partial [Sphingomonas sp.]|uniref:hypothetical protein n=1 Tax=Sphingomonas sp. TaxID=28214 RepID=UPI003F6E851A